MSYGPLKSINILSLRSIKTKLGSGKGRKMIDEREEKIDEDTISEDKNSTELGEEQEEHEQNNGDILKRVSVCRSELMAPNGECEGHQRYGCEQ